MMVGVILASVVLGIAIGMWLPSIIGHLLRVGQRRRVTLLIIQEANDRALQHVKVPQQRFRSMLETEEAARRAAGRK